MKEFTIGPNDSGQRLDRFLSKAVPLLPASLAQKYIRIKRIKLNGGRAERDSRLQAGDVLQLYINDEFFDKPREENSFTPALCNRIDRNTGGIVIAAKTAEALRVMNQKIKDRELDKRYLAIVEGTPRPPKGSLKGYLFKDAKKNRVFVTDTPQTGAKSCQTNYVVLASQKGLSLVECELITGRTHQIRAQFAHAGHPLLGDGKYGKLDKRFDRSYQALYSYKLTFCFTTDAGALEHLNGKSFQVTKVDFAEEYFPGIKY